MFDYICFDMQSWAQTVLLRIVFHCRNSRVMQVLCSIIWNPKVMDGHISKEYMAKILFKRIMIMMVSLNLLRINFDWGQYFGGSLWWNKNPYSCSYFQNCVRGRFKMRKKVDTRYTLWNQIQVTINQYKMDIGRIVVMLSLIHIWRCRRTYACRSRWTPYQ